MMDRREQRQLVKALRAHIDRLADSVPGPSRSDHPDRNRAATAWVHLSAVLAWAEDHNLVDPWLRKGLHGMPGMFTSRPSVTVRLAQAFAGLTVHPATQWLMHPRYNPGLHAATPSEAALAELADWWATDAPNLATTRDGEPDSVGGWVVADLLQLLDDTRRKNNAFCQTPWWVADLLLDRTLVPACAEFADEPLVRFVDPTCGAGHIMVRAMDYLWEWWTTGSLHPRQGKGGEAATGGTPLSPAEALARVVRGVDGVELDPYIAAVARLRCTVYAAHLARTAGLTAGSVRLDRTPRRMVPRVGVGDSLLLGRVGRGEYDRLHPTLADLPGASFTLGDWDWTSESSPVVTAVPAVASQPALFDLAEGAVR